MSQGFYGNITNVSKSQFSFDKIYPSKRAMKLNETIDGIFIGRFVLVEYEEGFDANVAHQIKAVKKVEDDPDDHYYVYDDVNANEATKVKVEINTEEDEKYWSYVFLYNNTSITAPHQIYYYVKNDENGYGLFKLLDANSSFYNDNYLTDKTWYPDAGRGYDSTVWQKVIVDSKEQYVMIAELNTVIPTFDLTVVRPTVNPIAPHFGADSTNLYYDLHVQPQWGFRVASAFDDQGIQIYPTDETVTWISHEYDPKEKNYKIVEKDNIKAAIYYNAAGFNPEKHNRVDITKVQNTFSVNPTGSSGTIYQDHYDKTLTGIQDILEMKISLPAIGNMVSDGYDVIYGVNRKGYDEAKPINSEFGLKGILDQFEDISKDSVIIKENGSFGGASIEENNWIKGRVSDGQIVIEHKYNEDTTIEPETRELINGNQLVIDCPIKDTTGHVIAMQPITYTLPSGYGQIITDNGTINSDKSNASLSIKGDGTWLTTKVENNEIKIAFNLSGDNIEIKGDNTNSSVLTGGSIDEDGKLVFDSKTLGNVELGFNLEGSSITETSTLEEAFEALYEGIATGGGSIIDTDKIVEQIKNELSSSIIESATDKVQTGAGSGQFNYMISVRDGETPLEDNTITTIRFKAAYGYSNNWPVLVNGVQYTLLNIDGSEVKDKAWVSGSVVTLNLDNSDKVAYLMGGGSSGSAECDCHEYSTIDLVPGVSALEEGKVYLVYEDYTGDAESVTNINYIPVFGE